MKTVEKLADNDFWITKYGQGSQPRLVRKGTKITVEITYHKDVNGSYKQFKGYPSSYIDLDWYYIHPSKYDRKDRQRVEPYEEGNLVYRELRETLRALDIKNPKRDLLLIYYNSIIADIEKKKQEAEEVKAAVELYKDYSDEELIDAIDNVHEQAKMTTYLPSHMSASVASKNIYQNHMKLFAAADERGVIYKDSLGYKMKNGVRA